MRRYRSLVVGAAASLAVFGLSGTAQADGDDHHGGHDQVREIEAEDDCEPESFNAVIGPGTCVGNGDTTFEEFVAELVKTGEADDWEFEPDRLKVERGTALRVENEGGEFHTFTPVEEFGGGCIEEVNELLGLEPVPECDDPTLFEKTGIDPGEERTFRKFTSDVGVQKFICLIHPWMTAVVNVHPADHDDHHGEHGEHGDH